MFASKGTIYTVHEKEDARDVAERVVLVREGFSIWAFLLTFVWLLAHRLWLMSAIYIVLAILLVRASEMLGLSHLSVVALQVGLQFWLGSYAHDAQRAALARKGYTEVDIVCAESELLAERRYYDRHAYRYH